MAPTDEELTKLHDDGVRSDQLVWTEYFFSHFHSSWEERQAFREDLRHAGFTGIGSDEELTGDGLWHHWSHTICPAEPDMLRAADELAAKIVEAHGARYDGWDVRRDPATDEPYRASVEDRACLEAEDERSFTRARRSS